MKKSVYFGFFILFMLVCDYANGQVFILENSSSTASFSDLEKAVAAAKDGDNLYLPGGRHEVKGTWKGYDGNGSYPKTLAVTKRINWIGGGYATGQSTPVIEGTVVFIQSASGSSITGTRFKSNLIWDNTSNMVISRCSLPNLTVQGVGSDNLFTENEVYTITSTTGNYSGGPNSGIKGVSLFVSKNIISGDISGLSNSSIKNNLFARLSNYYFSAVSHCSVENNVFINNRSGNSAHALSTHGSTFLTVRNNLITNGYFTATAESNITFENNLDRVEYGSVFIDGDKGDYHLMSDCVGKNAGTDGTDVGLFGTFFPFKESRLPSIPFFSLKEIAPETTTDQRLRVKIKIEAQAR